MLKQAKALFLDRLRLAVVDEPVCNGPPLFDALERNAYLLLGHNCVMLLPGILVPPFAGERYDEESLLSRVGWVIAHEFAHATAWTAEWQIAGAQRLFRNYSSEEHVEAAADLFGAGAVVRLGVEPEALCAHLSQLWCARTPPPLLEALNAALAGHPPRSHPHPSYRGNNICAFMESEEFDEVEE